MTSGVPWQVEGVQEQARESALEAARRSGMSVGEWLDAVIRYNAQTDEVGPRAEAGEADVNERAPGRHAYADYDDRRGRAGAEDLAEFRGRLDEVGRQLDQLSRLNTTQAYLRPNLRTEEPPRELVDVISRLDRRLDQLIASGHLPHEGDRPAATPYRERPAAALAGDPSNPLEQALMELAERQRA